MGHAARPDGADHRGRDLVNVAGGRAKNPAANVLNLQLGVNEHG